MNTKRKTSIKKSDLFSTINFCTECGKSLVNFALNKKSSTGKFSRSKQKECLKNGKFKGDICSKLFISLDEDKEDLKNYDLPANPIYPEDEF